MPVVAIVLGFVALVLFILGLTAVSIVRILKGDESGRPGGNDEEDTRTMQEINRSLGRMEDRIEALETLLLDAERGKRPPPPPPGRERE